MFVDVIGRFIGDEKPLRLWWIDDGALVDYTSGYAFVARCAAIRDPSTIVFTKSSGFTGTAGSGTKTNGTPNLTLTFTAGTELALPTIQPMRHKLQIVATHVADSVDITGVIFLDMQARI